MSTAQIRKRLHEIIDNTEDKKLKAIYTLLESEEDSYKGYSLSAIQKKELDRRLQDYHDGKGETYKWDEVIAKTDQALANRSK